MNACSSAPIAGPRISMPVSRHGSSRRFGSPSHRSLMHRPLTKPISPSTTIVLRWSRDSQPSGLDKCGGLKTRTSPPASRTSRHSESARHEPSQSTITWTRTPARARSASSAANSRPIASFSTMYASNRMYRRAPARASRHAGKFSRASQSSRTALPSVAGAPAARANARSASSASVAGAKAE